MYSVEPGAKRTRHFRNLKLRKSSVLSEISYNKDSAEIRELSGLSVCVGGS